MTTRQEIELRARVYEAVGTSLRSELDLDAGAFTELSRLVVDLERPVGQILDDRVAIGAHFIYACVAARVLPAVADILRIVDAGEAFCHRRAVPACALKFQHARSKLLVYRREFATALPLARAALIERRETFDDNAACCREDCYVSAVADALAGLGRRAEAIHLLDASLSANAMQSSLWSGLAHLFALDGDYAEALHAFDRSLACSDSNEVRRRRGVTHLLAGDTGRALRDLRAGRGAPFANACWLAAAGDLPALQRAPRDERWASRLAALMRGDASTERIQREAERRPYADPYVADAHFFSGLGAELRGDRVAARAAFAQALPLATQGSLVQLWATRRLAE